MLSRYRVQELHRKVKYGVIYACIVVVVCVCEMCVREGLRAPRPQAGELDGHTDINVLSVWKCVYVLEMCVCVCVCVSVYVRVLGTSKQ